MTDTNLLPGPGAAERRVDELSLKAERLRIPLNATVELTYRCNLDCVHCYCQHLGNTRDRLELGTDEWKRVLDELADLGSLHLTLTGGEILARRDFWEIARHAKRLHFSLTLFTNGTLLTEEAADRLGELRPTSIEMSLLGATRETHDRLTRTVGAWDRMMRAADLLRERGLPFVFKTTLMRGNFRELHALERTAKAHGCRSYRCGSDISPRNDGNREPETCRLGPRELFEYYLSDVGGEIELPAEPSSRALLRQKSLCGAGVTGCAITPYGDLLPCLQLMLPLGRLQERSLRDLWAHPPETIRRLRETMTYGDLPACAHCDVIEYCRRCHGLAHLEMGAWEACDTLARQLAEVERAVVRYRQEGILPEFPGETSVGAPDGRSG